MPLPRHTLPAVSGEQARPKDREHGFWRRHFIAALLLVFVSGLAIASERGRSWTADEDVHLIRGLSALWIGDTFLNFAHPPLANVLQAAPSAVLDERIDLSGYSGWQHRQIIRLSHQWVRQDFERAKRQIWRGRMVTVGFFAALCLAVYAVAWRLWGRTTACLALLFTGANTTILGHARLLTTDVPATFASFVCFAALLEYLRQRSWWTWSLLAGGACLVCVTKHSGGVLVAVCGVVAFLVALLGKGSFEHAGPRRRRTWIPIRDFAGIGLLVILAINAVYGFQRTGWTVEQCIAENEPTSWLRRRHGGDLLDDHPLFSRLPAQMRILLPYPYLVGLATVAEQNRGGHGNYFAGTRSPGHPAYFPVLLLIKTPLGILFLLGVAAWLWSTRRVRPRLATWVTVAFAAVFLLVAMRSRINIGIRHILPLMPMLALIAARAVTAARELGISPRLRAAISAAVVATPLGAIVAFPNYIGDFNWLVGGPRGGLYISVVGEDWGQDVTALGEYVTDNNIDPLYYYTQFTLRRHELRHAGVTVKKASCKRPPPSGGYVAIHRSDWQRSPGCFLWLRDRKPDAVIDHHIYLFENRDDSVSESKRTDALSTH